MVSLLDAEKILKDAKGVVYDSYEEFVDVYLFFDNQELGAFGGYNAPVVIEKRNGNLSWLKAFAKKFPELLQDEKFVGAGMVA